MAIIPIKGIKKPFVKTDVLSAKELSEFSFYVRVAGLIDKHQNYTTFLKDVLSKVDYYSDKINKYKGGLKNEN